MVAQERRRSRVYGVLDAQVLQKDIAMQDRWRQWEHSSPHPAWQKLWIGYEEISWKWAPQQQERWTFPKHPQQQNQGRPHCQHGKACLGFKGRPQDRKDCCVPELRSQVLCYVWQQDGAPAHTANKVQKFRQNNMANFWSKDYWPPSSPDLNPLDFFWWGAIEKRTNATPHGNVNLLKAAISGEWEAYPEEDINKTCTSSRGRIEACIKVERGHIEKVRTETFELLYSKVTCKNYK